MKKDQQGNPTKPVVRLYQGERDNLDVVATADTYNKAKQGAVLDLVCTIGAYHMNGKTGMYAKEVEQF